MRYLCMRGFSLIELMIVVAIISILAAISLPTYKTYTQKARFAEVISATIPFKTAVSLALQEGDPLNELTNGAYGIPIEPNPTKNLASIKVKKGVITATATKIGDDTTYILTPDKEGGTWSIDGTCKTKGWCED